MSGPADRLATMDLPLRGLASEGAAALVEPALGQLRGVHGVAVIASKFRVRVTYDPAHIAADTIREALHGIRPPDTAHGAPSRNDTMT